MTSDQGAQPAPGWQLFPKLIHGSERPSECRGRPSSPTLGPSAAATAPHRLGSLQPTSCMAGTWVLGPPAAACPGAGQETGVIRSRQTVSLGSQSGSHTPHLCSISHPLTCAHLYPGLEGGLHCDWTRPPSPIKEGFGILALWGSSGPFGCFGPSFTHWAFPFHSILWAVSEKGGNFFSLRTQCINLSGLPLFTLRKRG